MKIKDLEGTVNVAWSPAQQEPVLLAAGTAAQQLDASFSTNASLQLYSLNLNEPGLEMQLLATAPSEQRFHDVKWGAFGMANDVHANGVIVGGCDGGLIQIFSASKLLAGENGLISRQTKHSGPVHALDFNSFQSNLLASGSSESEIYIWDLNNTTTPMTPGAKSQPPEDVHRISWNCQVQHILCSASSTRCVVWDLRKNEPVIKLTDTASRIRWKDVSWHPEVGTQLCLASEEDQAPIIQLWDLRFATSPLKVLENHQRGVLSITWCKQDPDLLVSCGKDNRILCWNPNTDQPGGEVLAEIARTAQWNFAVNWCPRNPALIAGSSFDGHVSIYSLMGGTTQQVQTSNKIADSFPGMEGYAQAPAPQQTAAPVSVDLTKPPKWLKRPAGASFGFGGVLITFENVKSAAPTVPQDYQNQSATRPLRQVVISQVITEPSLVEKSTQLEQALEYGNFTEYCRSKAESMTDQHKRYIWYFLKANFEDNSRAELLDLLGYKVDDMNAKLDSHLQKKNDVDDLANQMSDLNNQGQQDDYNNVNSFDSNAMKSFATNNDWKKSVKPYKIKTGDDSDGLICQALLMGNVEAAVELCLEANRMADAIIIAMTGGAELLARTQFRYLQQSEGYVSSLISALVSEDWSSIIEQCSLDSWKEALVAAITHSSDEEFPRLCEQLGVRLENESGGKGKLFQDAQLCYICAGSFERLVASWSSKFSLSPDELQELIELVTFLQKAVERQGRMVEITGNLAELLSQYASILASQGHLKTALNYLGASQDPKMTALRERLFCNLGHKSAYGQQQPLHSTRNTSAANRQSFSSYPNQFGQQNVQYNQFNSGLPTASVPQQQWQQQTHPAPPPVQPPRPTSVGSTSGATSGLPGRSKYVVDPSVQSNMPSGGYPGRSHGFSNAMQPAQNVFQNPVPTYQTNAVSNSNPFMNSAPTSMAGGISNIPGSPAMVPSFPPLPTQNPGYPGVPTSGAFNLNAQASQTLSGPPMGGASIMTPVEIARPALSLPPPPLNYPSHNSAPGWNDPPMIQKSSRPPPPKPEVTPQSPITHPLYGSAAPEPVPLPYTNNGYGDVPNYGQVVPPVQMQHQRFQTTLPGYQAQQQQQQNIAQPQQGREEIPQVIQKAPIPEEHIHMQTVFDTLRNHCTCSANNPQTKRKLDDVARKLETLYDLLRDKSLSPSTLSSLHQMVQMVQNGDYTGGLMLHTQMVSGSDFSQIASFMPGLKVLLQSALQLNIYLR